MILFESSLWHRQGVVITPAELQGDYRLLQSPTAWVLDNGLLRVGFGARDRNNHAQFLSVDLDPEQNMKIVGCSPEPKLALSQFKSFGRHGIGPCDVQVEGQQLSIFASGVDLQRKPYSTNISCIISFDQGQTLNQPQHLIGPDDNGGFPVSMPTLVRHAGFWHLYFTAFFAWRERPGLPADARYLIRHAVSENAEQWQIQPGAAVGLGLGEAGLARPTVRPKDTGLEMWFSARGPKNAELPQSARYRLAYARSDDGYHWQRQDARQAFINPPQAGDWDEEMQCYPFVMDLPDGRQCLFYCGNGYGASGFGYALRCT